MSEDLLLRYANFSMPPAERVRDFIARDPRLQWVNPFLRRQPNADLSLGGATLRTILLGHIPATPHVTIHHTSSHDIRSALTPYGNFQLEGYGDVMTFAPNDAAHTIILSTTPQERKEFTVDSLTYRYRDHAIDDANGNGLDDIKTRTLRTTNYPLRTFANEPLATLRALRLAAQHEFTFAGETWHALTRSLPRLHITEHDDEGLSRFTIPRRVLGHALLDILAANSRYGASLVHASGLLSTLAPNVNDDTSAHSVAMLHTFAHPETLGGHGVEKLSNAATLAALLANEPNATTVIKNLARDYHLHEIHSSHPSHCDVDDTTWLLDNLRMFTDIDPASLQPSAFEKIFGNQRGRQLLALMHAVFLDEGTHHVGRERMHVARRLLDRYDEQRDASPKLLRGRDLDTLGIPPGPLYRRLLSKIRDAQLSGLVTNRDEAMHLLRLEIGKI